ncbi:MAG: sugar phosphate isomerase/epimerase family protein, partial [Thermoproteota archaeon]
IIEAEKALERLRKMNVRFIELSSEHLTKFIKDGNVDIDALKGIDEAADSLGIRILQVHGPYGKIDLELASSDPSERNKALKRVFKWIEFVGKFGWEVLVLHTARLKHLNNENTLSFVERIRNSNIECFKEVSKQAFEHGVKIAVENRLESGYGALPRDLLELVEEVRSDALGICFDTGHANVNGLNPVLMVESLGRFLIATHIHDNDGHGDQHLPPLMGSIDWGGLIEAFSKTGYSRPLILEVHEYGRLEMDDNIVKISSIVMNKLLEEH